VIYYDYDYNKEPIMADETKKDEIVTVNHPDGSVSTMKRTVVTAPDGTMVKEGFGVTSTDHNEQDEDGNPKVSVHVGPVHSDVFPGPMPVHLTPEEIIASERVN